MPDSTYLLTRRTVGRHFYLRPSQQVNAYLEFILGYAANKNGIILHEYIFLSNHWHAVVSDPLGQLPKFMEHFHKLSARALNAHLGRWESLWAVEPYSSVRLCDGLSQWKKAIYTVCNAVSSHLVRHPRLWPGASSAVDNPLQPREIKRPEGFFRKKGPVPKSIVMQCHPLPAARHLSQHQYLHVRQQLIERRVKHLQQQARENRRKFLPVRDILAQSPFARPRSQEPRRNVKPRVASSSRWRRTELLSVIKAFYCAYRRARLKLLAGQREVVFPEGTYWYRRFKHVRCVPLALCEW